MNAYNNFDGSLHLQIKFAYSFNEKYIYFGDQDLSIIAWGGRKSDARKYLEGWTNLTQCD